MSGTAEIQLPYGDKTLTASIPIANLMGVFAAPGVQISKPEGSYIRQAMSNPIGSEPLVKLVRDGMKVVIIADDKTRPTPVKKILPYILDELSSAGIPDSDISLVYALGTHQPMTEEEMVTRAGEQTASRIKLYNSEFKDPRGLTDCGKAPDGVRVIVDKRVAGADFKIAIGSIMPHPECGWGGGAKIIYPGVASEQTVGTFHLSYGYVDWNTYGSDKSPVRLNMENWVDTVGLDFIVNTIVTPDDKVYQVVAGHYIKAHRKGIEYGREIYSVELPEKADIVLITSFRADKDFWLASKAIFAGELVIKDGGVLILVTQCPQGVGPHPEYAKYCGCNQYDELLKNAFEGKTKDPISVSAAVAIAKMRKRFSIAIVSDGLPPQTVAQMKCEHYNSISDAVEAAIKKCSPQAQIAVMPDGINTVPVIKQDAGR